MMKPHFVEENKWRCIMLIKALDHLVLTVSDITVACEFYERVVGCKVVTFGDNRKALQCGNQKINLHRSGAEFRPCARQPTPGSADICFITATTIDDLIAHFKKCRVAIEEGPVQRTGARGPILSVYIRDPDENLIELSNYL
ncbi:MAG: VOC family protein [Desulfofustis sp.]|nr:VOC family protein [Desulfofustis sp.]